MRSRSSIGVHNNLAPSQPRVGLRAANHEPTSWVDHMDDLRGTQMRRHHVVHDVLNEELFEFRSVQAFGVLRGKNNFINRFWHQSVVAHRDLALGVGSDAVLACLE